MSKIPTMQVDLRHKRIKDIEALMLGAFNKTIPLEKTSKYIIIKRVN